MTRSRELGRQGEETAAEYLGEVGFRVIERNWRCPDGEVDIVAIDEDHNDLVIVEVKTRRGHGAGHPFEAVTPEKFSRLRRLALAWCRQHPSTGRGLRIDIVGITVWGDGTASIQHIEGADA